MDELIEVSKPIKVQSNSWAVFIKSEAESLGLKPGDAMALVCTSPQKCEFVHSLLYGSDPYLYFVAVLEIEGKIRYDIRKSLSEYFAERTYDIEPLIVLGPLPTLERAAELKDYLAAKKPTSDTGLLAERFRSFQTGQ